MPTQSWIYRHRIFLASLLLVGMFALELCSSLSEAQTVDEGVHLVAGYYYLQTRDFGLNEEHPPLVKLVAALPLVLMNAKLDLTSEAAKNRDQYQMGREFLYHAADTIAADTKMLVGRMPSMMVSLLLGVLIFRFMSELASPRYRSETALAALALYASLPIVLAHARYITTDIGAAAGFTWSLYAMKHYFEIPSKKRLAILALAVGVALVTKFSTIFLLPIFVLLFLLRRFWSPAGVAREPWRFKRLVLACGGVLLVAYGVAWIVYVGEIHTPLSDSWIQEVYTIYNHPLVHDGTAVSFMTNLLSPARAFGAAVKWLAAHVPIPAFSYFKGFALLSLHDYYGHTAFLFGEWSKTGWWYFFPVSFLLKTPLVVIGLLLFSGALFAARLRQRLSHKALPFSWVIIIVAGSAYAFFALTSNINLGLRHLLPIMPLMVFACAKAWEWLYQRVPFRLVAVSCILFPWLTAFTAYPHYLSYCNVLGGGSSQCGTYLADSNVDWGQDLKRLALYLEEQHTGHILLQYNGTAEPAAYGISFDYLPQLSEIQQNGFPRGIAVVDIGSLRSPEEKFQWITSFPLIDRVGTTFFVYDLR